MEMIRVVFIFFIIVAGNCSDEGQSAASDGPTVILKNDKTLKNFTPDFIYFVPLISPTSVYSQTSKDNEQKSGLIEFERKSTPTSFYVSGEFQMQGSGFHSNKFDSAEMIARSTKKLKKGKPLKNILGYIKFEGEGYGWIEIKGVMDGKKADTTEVKVHFNGRGEASPVTVGLYSVKPVNGEYKYENKYNEIVARVNTITFVKSTGKPLMSVQVSEILCREGDDPVFAGKLKAAIANLLIKPIEIDKSGNDTMLDFGCALFNEKETFTFPKAKNLKYE